MKQEIIDRIKLLEKLQSNPLSTAYDTSYILGMKEALRLLEL